MVLNFLLESGAACSIIRKQDLLNIDMIQNKIFNQHQNVVTANGSRLNINFQLELELNMNNLIVKQILRQKNVPSEIEQEIVQYLPLPDQIIKNCMQLKEGFYSEEYGIYLKE